MLFFEAYKSPISKRRKLLAKRPFLAGLGKLFQEALGDGILSFGK